MVKSIFELEKRTDIRKECLRIEKYLAKPQFINFDGYYHNNTFWSMVNSCFKLWPHRYTATNASDFFDLLELHTKVEEMNNTEYFYYLQFIYDFVMWVASHYYDADIYGINFNKKIFDLFINNQDEFDLITTNIKIIMDFSNYSIEKINDHYTFIKRDADTDSILSIIENENDLRLALLEYNDFRIENDVEEKKKLIFKIYQFIELHKKDYQEKNNTLYKSISHIVNNYKIRHSNSCQISLNDSGTIEVYDICFKMMIHLIRDSYIKDSFKKIKEKYESNM